MPSANDRSASSDEEYDAILQEIRILLPGVEILFAFLLGVGFTERASDLAGLKWVYFSALFSAALASILLATPSVYHRMRWREADKEVVLKRANTIALVGSVFLGTGIVSSLYLAVAVLSERSLVAAIASTLAGVAAITMWFVVPMLDKRRDRKKGRTRRRSSAA